jgi:flagellar biosynthesis protein FlhG
MPTQTPPPVTPSARYSAPRIIAVAGGKGGVGKSTIAVNLALAIGRLGHDTVLVDADLGAANLHTMLGVLHPEATLADFLDHKVETLDDVALQVAPLVTFIAGTSRPNVANLMGVEKLRLLRAIPKLEADCVVIDIGAGSSTLVLEMLALADHKLVVMAPQLTSLHNAYALLKASVHRAVRRATTSELHQSLIDAALGGEQKARTIPQLLNVLRPLDAAFTATVETILARYGVSIVGNQITSDAEALAITKMSPLILDHLQISAPIHAAIRRSPSLAGSLKAGANTIASRTDDSRASFQQLARALVDTDLAQLRGQRMSQPIALRLSQQMPTFDKAG